MWIVLTSVCSFVILITIMMLCLCWRKKTQKNDLLGLDGLVTQKNPDENVNHLPSAIAQTVSDGIKNATGDTANDANKSSNRPVTVNNPRRSLPDIPSDGVRNDGDTINYEPNGDNSSDLYATVEPYQNSTKRHTLPNGIDSQPSISQHSSISQADDTFSPYARVREHPYDKLLKTEHPYARVHPSNGGQEQEENSSGEATPRIATIRTERISVAAQTASLGESTATCRSQRSSGQNSVELEIPAASAVAGGIAANQELPYMTPPIIQPNFSGDSQDSSKGYTSISVREPLANIRAQTKVINKLHGGDLDPHYSTVSDDSDDMYTTIQDPNNAVYTSGSETYAQIEPPQVMVAAEVNPNITSSSSDVQFRDEEFCAVQLQERAPQPPSVDSLKHVTHTHSRQASSSSSVVGNLVGSPKPEKRQANSPLPPPPPTAASTDLLSATDKLSTCRNLDDMYAKVQKGKKRSDEQDSSRTSLLKENENLQGKPTSERIEEYEQSNESVLVSSIVSKDDSFLEHNYETLRKSPRKGDGNPGYEKLKLREPQSGLEPGYDTISGPDSILSSDPGYEVLKHSNEMSSEVDPNYEELRHEICTSTGGYTIIGNKLCVHNDQENNGYSMVNKQSKQNSSSEEAKSKNSSSYESDGRDLSTDEPNYESMPSESLSEHNYAILKSTGSESDPNYESVHHSDPNYESVKYLDVTLDDPPYHQLLDEDSSKSSECVLMENVGSEIDVGYEKVKTEASPKENIEDCGSNIDPGYETIKNDSGSSNVNVQLENDYDGIVQV